MILGKLFRLLLYVTSVASFLVGAALAALGIWLMAGKNSVRSVLNLVDVATLPQADQVKGEAEALLDKYDILSTVGIVILIVGACIAGLAILGALGAMCNIKIILLVYILFFIALVTSLIYLGTLKARMSAEIFQKLTELQESYFVSVVSMIREPNSVKASMTAVLNFMQIMLRCCGLKYIGDTRNSTSWLGSERRLIEMFKEGAAILPAAMTTDLRIPDWLKPHMPNQTMMPAGVQIPSQLPSGFELPKDFKDKVANLAAANFTEAFKKLLADELTLRTPITCCEMNAPDDLLKGKYDVKNIYAGVKVPSCALSASNVGVNKLTCYQALLDYISKYQHVVGLTGTVLAVILGCHIFLAVWILVCE